MSEETNAKSSLLDEIIADVRECWQRLPNKLLFGVMLLAWVLLFQFWGNITLGYVKTNSLFGWLNFVYTTSPDDEHGKLIPLVVLALFWWKRRDLMEVAKDTWWPAFAFIFLAIGLHLLGFRVQQTRFSAIAFVIGLYGMLGLVWGKEFMKRSFFPMFLFAFCVPLGTEADRITAPLRLLATKITAGVANGILGIGVMRDGTRVFDPAGQYQYEVAAACSGIRSLTAIFAFATIYSFITFQKNWKRLVMIVCAFPLAIISNVMRLLMIILAAELFDQNAGNMVHEHWFWSLLPYIPAIFGVLGLGYLLREPETSQPKSDPPPPSTSQPQLA